MKMTAGYAGIEVYHYEVGDLVRLFRDEEGDMVTAYAGDWGRVTRVNRDGSLDIDFAGYGRPRGASMPRAIAVAHNCVEPCDARGAPRPRGRFVVWGTRRDHG